MNITVYVVVKTTDNFESEFLEVFGSESEAESYKYHPNIRSGKVHIQQRNIEV